MCLEMFDLRYPESTTVLIYHTYSNLFLLKVLKQWKHLKYTVNIDSIKNYLPVNMSGKYI